MNAGGETDDEAISRRTTFVRRVLLGVLIVYWIALFIGTHLPPKDVPDLGPNHLDKVVHFLAYAGLAFLLSTWLFTCNWSTARTAAVVLTILVTYAVADELLQIGVGRTADFWDWVADVLGSGLGLGVATVGNAILPLQPDAER